MQPHKRGVARVGNAPVGELAQPGIADVRGDGDLSPLAALGLKSSKYSLVKLGVHGTTLAIVCYERKQQFAMHSRHSADVDINLILAKNLRALMAEQGLTQMQLSKRSGVAQTTISLYLNPDKRSAGSKGRPPSAKLAEAQALAEALGVEMWELLRDLNPTQRDALRAFDRVLRQMAPPAPDQGGHLGGARAA